MPIENKGTFSLVICPLSKSLPEDVLEQLDAVAGGRLDDVGSDPEVAWVGGRHLLETDINEKTSLLGGHLHVNLRKAERKIPASLLNAICRRDELAYMLANDTQNVPRQERKRIKEDAIEKNLMKMPPVISSTTVTVDRDHDVLYAATGSLKTVDEIISLFIKQLNVEPVPLTVNELMIKFYKQEANQLPPVDFGDASDSSGEPTPGRDFLTWLWFHSETEGGVLNTPDGIFRVAIEGPLVFGFTSDEPKGAEESVVKKGCPLLSAEAKAALSVGKKLKKAKVILTREEEIWSFTFDADRFTFGGVSLPEGDEMEPHALFAERIELIHVMRQAFEGYFKLFADAITGPDRAKREKAMLEWARNRESY